MKNYNMNLFLLNLSPWPITFSVSLLFLFLNVSLFFFNSNILFVFVNLILIMVNFFLWWNDVILEATYLGFHNKIIIKMMMYSMILFIVSEIFFFISFFWTYFHFLLSPDIMIGLNWPYFGINFINFMNLPLLNSLLLISSGCTITLSHHKIMSNKFLMSKVSLFLSFFLGILFLLCQLFEYKTSFFCFSDGCFGSIFFIATGFHGIHVLIGTIFLIFMFIRMLISHFSYFHMIGYEFSIWYWHFVDVVWLYLYMMVYWLGS